MFPEISSKEGETTSLIPSIDLQGTFDGQAVVRNGGTKGDQIVSALKAYIAGGAVEPGEKISLRKLAAALDVSVMPVRNAVARLQADGVLDVEPGRAIRVRTMTADEFRELTAVRQEIEGFAAQQAALNRSKSDLSALGKLRSKFENLVLDGSVSPSEAARINMHLHFMIYQSAKMPTLLDIIERLWIKAGPVVFYYIKLARTPSPSNHGIRLHKVAYEAIRDKDPQAARAAIVEDIELASERLLSSEVFGS